MSSRATVSKRKIEQSETVSFVIRGHGGKTYNKRSPSSIRFARRYRCSLLHRRRQYRLSSVRQLTRFSLVRSSERSRLVLFDVRRPRYRWTKRDHSSIVWDASRSTATVPSIWSSRVLSRCLACLWEDPLDSYHPTIPNPNP